MLYLNLINNDLLIYIFKYINIKDVDKIREVEPFDTLIRDINFWKKLYTHTIRYMDYKYITALYEINKNAINYISNYKKYMNMVTQIDSLKMINHHDFMIGVYDLSKMINFNIDVSNYTTRKKIPIEIYKHHITIITYNQNSDIIIKLPDDKIFNILSYQLFHNIDILQTY